MAYPSPFACAAFEAFWDRVRSRPSAPTASKAPASAHSQGTRPRFVRQGSSWRRHAHAHGGSAPPLPRDYCPRGINDRCASCAGEKGSKRVCFALKTHEQAPVLIYQGEAPLDNIPTGGPRDIIFTTSRDRCAQAQCATRASACLAVVALIGHERIASQSPCKALSVDQQVTQQASVRFVSAMEHVVQRQALRVAQERQFRRHSTPVCSVSPQDLVSASVDVFDEARVCNQHIRTFSQSLLG